MTDFFDPASLTTLTVAIETAMRATVLIVLAVVVHAALGPRRALARSALWNACLGGLLLLPLASWALPRMPVSVLPPRETVAVELPTPPRPVSFHDDPLATAALSTPARPIDGPMAGASKMPAIAMPAPADSTSGRSRSHARSSG